MQPQPGQLVHVRARPYLVEEVVPPPAEGDDTLVRMSCLADDAQGDPLEVLWEREVDARILGGASWAAVTERGFDDPRRFAAYIYALSWSSVTATDPDLFQAPYRAGIDVKSYQLQPLRKALHLPRVNLFIADDVGLGKTIEAGLILQEMRLRQKVRRIVVACPPSVVRQWQEEMEQRFGMGFVVFDRAWVAQQRQERGYGVNPWNAHTRFVISHALLRDEAYAGPLRDWLGAFCPGAILVLDEAHNAAPASSSRYAIDSRLTRAVRDLAGRFEHRLFLSATPHNGHSNSFAALLEILDPQRFCRGVPIRDPKQLEEVMVRRLKQDLRHTGSDFPERRVEAVVLDGLPEDTADVALSQLLQRYREAREVRLADAPPGRRAAEQLVLTSLQKRLLSSVEAFARTLKAHRLSLERRHGGPLPTVRLADTSLLREAPGADDERAELPEEEVEEEASRQIEAATRAAEGEGGQPSDLELALLGEMTRIASTGRHRRGPKVDWLLRWIDEHLCPGSYLAEGESPKPGASAPKWLPHRLLIFTEYADTKGHLKEQLEGALAHTEDGLNRLGYFHGGMGEDAREEIKRAFNQDPEKHPLRILVATDAAREGVNLQNHCADLLHFDVPWNPSRLEQRNGRIDRKLQRAPVVHCRYFVLPQRAEDRVLDLLVTKTDTILRELGSLSPVVDRTLTELLEDGIRHPEIPRLSADIDGVDPDPSAAIRTELEGTRTRTTHLAAEIEALEELLKRSAEWLHISPDLLRETVSAGLELTGQPPLRPETSWKPSGGGQRWCLPEAESLARDGSWADTLDTLRRPRGRQEKIWAWRKEAPIRPVVFMDPGSLDGEVVHLHLEHRLTQRLLGRFAAQGFQRHDLARACVVGTDRTSPEVILLGRLSLYGARSARLHDVLVAARARWREPDLRDPVGALPRLTGDFSVLDDLAHAFASPDLLTVPEHVRRHLARSAPKDVEALLPHLQETATAIEARARVQLVDRGAAEAGAMEQILEAQGERIASQVQSAEQLALPFSKEERRQLDADRRHWQRRLEELEADRASEPARIRAAYEVQARRLEPIGLVYLWPRNR